MLTPSRFIKSIPVPAGTFCQFRPVPVPAGSYNIGSGAPLVLKSRFLAEITPEWLNKMVDHRGHKAQDVNNRFLPFPDPYLNVLLS